MLSGKCKVLDNFSDLSEGKLEKLGNITESCSNIDRVPEIFVDDGPHVAFEWVIRGRFWTNLSLVKEIDMKGCYIVQTSYYGHKSNNILDWKCSFSLTEMIIGNTRKKEIDLSYLVLIQNFTDI